MCGIFGIIRREGPPQRAALEAMQAALIHRGPDAQGIDIAGRVGLGNVRLSILDLSPAGDQPVFSDDGRIALIQNGEIYNYVELREELSALGAQFRSTGDTEVLLRAFEQWGPDFVTRLQGMFAIAVHDRRTDAVWLYRDRIGVKPLYIAERPEGVYFASEIKAILAAGVPAAPDLGALASILGPGFIPPPRTAFEGIAHVPPATRLKIGARIESTRYWRLEDVQPEDMTAEEAAEATLALADDATRVRLRSDAPFGAFLSGGVDSASVVGLMSRHMAEPVHSFSIGFDDPRFDETPHAEAAAARFGARHHAEMAEPDIVALWPRFIWHCDQPHQDVSFMPTDLVSRLARRRVKMVLTGDGGDELYGGYTKYTGLFPGGAGHEGWEDDYARSLMVADDAQARGLFTGAMAEAWAGQDIMAPVRGAVTSAPHQDPINRVLIGDVTLLLPGNNLVKPDRMSMANSLEVRSPYLDYRLAELAFRIPGHLKLAGGRTKAVLKEAVRPLIGDALTDRAKQMFTMPIGEWFKDALAPYCREILLDGRMGARGWVDEAAARALVEAHLSGAANHTRQVRALISLEIWARLFLDRDADLLAKARA
ncbi:MAG: asparagine synthase (glutamine-hydrolyzing) [Pseudomonadota bacterium]